MRHRFPPGVGVPRFAAYGAAPALVSSHGRRDQTLIQVAATTCPHAAYKRKMKGESPCFGRRFS